MYKVVVVKFDEKKHLYTCSYFVHIVEVEMTCAAEQQEFSHWLNIGLHVN